MPGIIVGIDGSGHSRRALQWAMREAAIRRAPLTVLTVHQVVVGCWGRAVVYLEDYPLAECARRAAQQEVDDMLADLARLAESGPQTVTVKVVSGAPVEELIAASRTADLLVLGSRGAGGFARLLIGSIAFQVADHAHCPLVIIPPADRALAERTVIYAPRSRLGATWPLTGGNVMAEPSSRKALAQALATAEAEMTRIGLLADARLNEAGPDQALVSVLALTRIGGVLVAIGYELIELLPDDQSSPSADPYPGARHPHIPAPRGPGFLSS